MASKEELLEELSRCVLEMEDDEISEVAKAYADAGYDPLDGILKGLVDGMNKAAQLYEEEEYFLPELLICSAAMYNGLDVLRPLLSQEKFGNGHKIVMGVVQGDTHDIGKNLVKIMLESAGYELIDLGRDVPVEEFVKAVKEYNASVLGMSTLMSTSMNNMKKVIELLEAEGIRSNVKVVVGGGPISRSFADKIGADGYSVNAIEAVHLVDKLVGISR
ncbi:corrinoid protein [Anaeropeptidivorans aminofermentans]|jgi:corrinoid protein of di/trimethylamine methyltransferase|uniref:corrinoid protein n=1 Tax=Anaeropeptidivorans aminofermentans TaxID=2934315 RepID=UPI002ED189A0|nr:cobalamin-binding protein [Lachnospiraceae bacterium]